MLNNENPIHIISGSRGDRPFYRTKSMLISFIVLKFIDFVDQNSKARDSSYDKNYTIEDLKAYVPYFVTRAIDKNII